MSRRSAVVVSRLRTIVWGLFFLVTRLLNGVVVFASSWPRSLNRGQPVNPRFLLAGGVSGYLCSEVARPAGSFQAFLTD